MTEGQMSNHSNLWTENFDFLPLGKTEQIMESPELRSRIREYVGQADERILRIFNAIIEVEDGYPASAGKSFASTLEPTPAEEEKSEEEGIGKLKDDHRMK